jgi:hypothetical protein
MQRPASTSRFRLYQLNQWYNLATDIGEANNLATSAPEKAQELRQRLNLFLRDAVKPGNPAPENLQKAKNRNKKKAAK